MGGSADHNHTKANGHVDTIDDASRAQKLNSRSSSTSSSSSSGEDFFQLTATELTKPIAGAATERSNAEQEKPVEATTSSSPADDRTGNRAVFAGSESRDQDSSGPLLGLNQTPIHGIEGYDPNRIPASVFARPKPSPRDWSTASNESLFSIQMGNSSFSRDHVFLFGRSGEHGDFSYSPSPEATPAFPPAFRSGEMSLGRPADPRRAASTDHANAHTMKDVLRSVAEEHAPAGDVLPDGALRSSGSSRSDASSIQSFAFPILAGGIGSMKVVPEQEPQKPEREQVEPAPPRSPPATPKPPPHSKWLLCFSCSFCHTD